MLGEGRISLLLVPLPDPHPAPSWGDLNEAAEAECTVSPPTPPSWAEMVRRGMNPGQSGSTPPPHPTPAVQHLSPPFDQLLNLYKSCVAEGRWARFTLETRHGEEEFSFNCSGRAAAPTALSPACPKTRRRARKCPPNERRREKERRRQEQKKEKRRAACKLAAAAPSATTTGASATGAAATEAAATGAAATGAAATGAAAKGAASTGAASTGAASTGAAATGAAATGAAAKEAAAPPAKHLKSAAFASRVSARSAVVSKRREGRLSCSFALESLEKIRGI